MASPDLIKDELDCDDFKMSQTPILDEKRRLFSEMEGPEILLSGFCIVFFRRNMPRQKKNNYSLNYFKG